MEELTEAIGRASLDQEARAGIEEIARTMKSNLEKVSQHGRRADSIVKNMLLHSRASGGERREVDLNALVEESLNLAYHGARAEKPSFDIALAMDLADRRVEVYGERDVEAWLLARAP